MQSLIPSAVALGLAALAALSLAAGRPSPPDAATERVAAARVLALAVVIQCAHFIEEALTGFHVRLGDLFGLPDMPLWLFVGFNVLWIGIWVASVWGIRSGRAFAFFAAWFLAIAGMINGIAHPLLAWAGGGYFPGLVSSPLVAGVCVWLWVRLHGATRAGATPAA